MGNYPIVGNGQEWRPGLRWPQQNSGFIRRMAYVQEPTNFFESIGNMYKLKPTQNLSGMEKFFTNWHNICAAYYNPFAAGEFIKNGFKV